MDYSDLLAAMSAKKEIQIKCLGQWRTATYNGLFCQMATGELIEWRERVTTMVQKKQSVPAPMETVPNVGEKYFVPNLVSSDFFSSTSWDSHSLDLRYFERGLVYATAEDAAARAQAMLNISEE